MQRYFAFAAVAVLILMAPGISAAQSAEGDEFRAQFEAIIAGLNKNTFGPFHDAIDRNDFLNRIFGTRVVADEAKEAFSASFKESIERAFAGSFPAARNEAEQGDIIGTLISLEEQGGQARAIVRYEGKGYRYSYHAYDLVRGRGGRVQIIDWFDFYSGDWFTREVGGSLVVTMPEQDAVKGVLDLANPTTGQLFQAGELFKAARDRNPRRYFQIYEGLDETLKAQKFIAHLTLEYARALRDARLMESAVTNITTLFPDDPAYALGVAQYYVERRRFEDAISRFERFQEALGMKDGAMESLKATAAMALGEFERAEAFAESATDVEPTLELAWWTLLRTRTAAGDYEGAIEPLTELEDRFGYLLIPQKLRRDRFLRVLIDQKAYQDWRASRDEA